MSQVLIYLDEGVGTCAFQQLNSSLNELLPSNYSIKAVNHRFFLSSDWEASTDLVVFPGGRDLHYHSALKGEGNTRIRQYVEQGGRYLGFCAGAYYGASYIEFEKGNELEVCGSRELAFFPGRAIGPAYGSGLFSYHSEVGSRAAFISWDQDICPIYFNGGCYFEEADQYPSIQVIARYNDIPSNPAAVIYCQVGHGASILSGVHPEFAVSNRDSSSVSSHLIQAESQRRAFLDHLVNKILT